MSQTTPWFPCKTPPVRRGWYEVKCHYGMFPGDGRCHRDRLYWSGSRWYIDTAAAKARWTCSFGLACDTWRGLKGTPEQRNG